MNAHLPERQKTLHDYLRMLRRHVWLIAATTLLAAGVAVALSARQHKTYTARAKINFVDPLASSGIVGAGASSQAPANLAATGSARLTQTQTLGQVKQLLGTSLSISQLRGAVSSVTDPGSFLVTASAQGRTPLFAAQLVNADIEQTKKDADAAASALFARVARNYQAQLAGLTPSQRNNPLIVSALYDNLARARTLAKGGATAAEVESTAQPPSSPSSPKPILDGILGGVLGLILGCLVAAVREAFDRRLGGARDIEAHVGLPLVGRVREESLGKVTAADGVLEIEPLDLEAFRILRSNMEFLDPDQPPRTVVVTSARPEEGKTTVAVSLAFASAAAGRRTLLVECDLRRPQFARRLGISSSPGLGDYLTGTAQPEDVVQALPIRISASRHADAGRSNALNGRRSEPAAEQGGTSQVRTLACITAGTHSSRPAELLASKGFRNFLSEVASAYDFVVLDTSPLLPVADTLELIPNVDALLVCIRASRTTREEVQAAKIALERFPERPTGIVVTGVRDPHEGGYYYAYPYAYDYTPTEVQSASR